MGEFRPQSLVRVAAVLSAAFLLVMGQGLVGTLTSAEGRHANFSSLGLGVIGAGYYLGFVLGCISSQAFVRRLSHRLLFAAAAVLAGLAASGYLVATSPAVWFSCRTAIGFCCANLYVVIESWLNDIARNANRGRTFGAYALVKQAGSLFSQSTLIAAGAKALSLFPLAAACYVCSAIPLLCAPLEQPEAGERTRLLPREVWRAAPSGTFVCAAAGLANGAIWSFAPGYGAEHGFPHGMAGAFMGAFILGGILMAVPLGWISDRTDRRRVMLAAAACAAMAEISLISFPLSRHAMLSVMLVYGMSALPLYALGVAWTNDRMPRVFVVGTAATLLFFNSLASVVSPLAVGVLAQHFGPGALFAYTALVHATVAAWVLWNIIRRPLPGTHNSRLAT